MTRRTWLDLLMSAWLVAVLTGWATWVVMAVGDLARRN